MTTQIERVQLLIDRGSDVKTPCIVFDFEVPILQDMHEGAGSHVIEEKRWPIQTDMSAQDAHAMIMGKYGQKESGDIARNHYRDAGMVHRKTGLPFDTSADTGPAQALINARNPEAEAANPQPSETAPEAGGNTFEPNDQEHADPEAANAALVGAQDQGGGSGGGDDGQHAGA